MANKAGLASLYAVTAKHLGPGSACPPLASDVVRCYTNKYCPFAQRAHLVLAAKQPKHEFVLVNLKAKPGWLFEKNPRGKLPVLEHNGRILYESLVICDYLEEVYPDPPLYPADPWARARDRMLAQLWSKGSFALHKLFFSNGDEKIVTEAKGEMQGSLDMFEEELKQRGTVFFGGYKPGMLDYMIWPWAERFILAKYMLGGHGLLPSDRYPALVSWNESMMLDPAVAATYLSPEDHARFYGSFDGIQLNLKSAL